VVVDIEFIARTEMRLSRTLFFGIIGLSFILFFVLQYHSTTNPTILHPLRSGEESNQELLDKLEKTIAELYELKATKLQMEQTSSEVKKLQTEYNELREKYNKIINCPNIDEAIDKLIQMKSKFKYLPQSQYEQIPCTRQYEKLMTPNDILFGIITGRKNTAKYEAVRRTWAKNLPLFFMSDTIGNPLVVTSARTNGTNDYGKSQLKFIDTIIYAHNNVSFYDKYQWLFLGDDDTHVNVPSLLNFASKWDVRMPVLFCFVWDIKEWDNKFCSGGGGTLITRAALSKLAIGFISEECSAAGTSDVNIAICAQKMNVMIVHSNQFHAWAPEHYDGKLQNAPFVESVTHHYVDAKDAFSYTLIHNDYWNRFYDSITFDIKRYKPILNEDERIDFMQFADEVKLASWASDSEQFCHDECKKTNRCNYWQIKDAICTLLYVKAREGQEIPTPRPSTQPPDTTKTNELVSDVLSSTLHNSTLQAVPESKNP
jgi:hypothetical protein